MDVRLLAAGIAIGLAMTAPLGPVNILVIRNAIRRGFLVAFLVGLGAVAGDIVYATAAAYGISWISAFIETYAKLLMLLGGILLAVMGVLLARKRIHLEPAAADEPTRAGRTAGKMLTAFGLTLTNPGEFFGFIAIFGSMNAVLRLHEDGMRPLIAVCGVALGAAAWWLFLSYIVSRFRARISERALTHISRWTGILIAAFGFALIMEAVG